MHRRFFLLGGLLLGVFIVLLFGTARANFIQVLILWGVLVGGYVLMLRELGLSLGKQKPLIPDSSEDALRARRGIWMGIIWRVALLAALPNLSDDYFRFVWDGRLWTHGVNPFAALPIEHMADPVRAQTLGLTPELFEQLNSPKFHTIYPPILQGIFWLAATLSPHSVMGAVWVMKAFVFAAECGSLWLMRDLLRRWGIPQVYVAFYALNPLVVVELCGNLHFEALMITALLGAVWLLERYGASRWWLSALSLGLGVATKLLPLMLVPLMLRRLGLWRTVGYGLVVVGLTILLFSPIFDLPTLQNLLSSVDLYFHRFEFNASIHYVVRWVGRLIYGRNMLRSFGTWLAVASVVLMLIYTFAEKRPTWRTLPEGMLWFFVFYFALSPIVHPWYGTTLVALSTFTRWRWPLVWSLLLPLSYVTYRSTEYDELLWVTAIIYVGAFVYGVWEWRQPIHPPPPETAQANPR